MNRKNIHKRLRGSSKLTYLLVCFTLLIGSCREKQRGDVRQKEVVETPAEINTKAEDLIRGTLDLILAGSKDLPDSLKVKNPELLQSIYQEVEYKPLWSNDGKFSQKADSLAALIDSSRFYGLFPEDYYHTRLNALRNQLVRDTSKQKKLDASSWAYSDLMLSSAFVQLVKDLKVGRLIPDTSLAKDSSLSANYFARQLSAYEGISNDSFARKYEPKHLAYWKAKEGLRMFLADAEFLPYTYVAAKDSAEQVRLLYKRLTEEDSALVSIEQPDSSQLSEGIRAYQKFKKMKADGKSSADLVRRLNNTDAEKFIRIAINLDRYKQLPLLPVQHIWVNIPGYYLEVMDSDTVALYSKVCVGKPVTKTPLITSYISDMITYPKWTIPESIVKKEILPGLKRDPGYTQRKGYSLIDKDGNEVDPYSVKWSKYTDYIPYKVVQGSGDDNALGVLKFNFPNKFSVYLHDTNQRYLFSRTNRALSHGCVRVQSWYELSTYILRNDSLQSKNPVPKDSLDSWLAAKQKRYLPVRKPLPLFIRYFTLDVNKEGKLVFYDDVYSEDRKYREKIFASKTFL